MRTVFLVAFLIFAGATQSFAAQNQAASANVDDIQLVLNRLQGQSGLYGATPEAMAAFATMVQPPELAKVVGRLHQQMLEQGYDPENVDLQTVSSFVRQNLTRDDVEHMLGRGVTQGEFQQGLQAGSQQQNLDALVQMLK